MFQCAQVISLYGLAYVVGSALFWEKERSGLSQLCSFKSMLLVLLVGRVGRELLLNYVVCEMLFSQVHHVMLSGCQGMNCK